MSNYKLNFLTMNINIIIKEIRKRSVWQVIGIYLVAGWGAFEAITSLTKTAGLPEWFPAGSLAVLILFLPVVIAVSLLRDSNEERPLVTSKTIDTNDNNKSDIEINLDKSINWKPAFFTGAGIMIMLSILGIIFLPNEENIESDISSGLASMKTISEKTSEYVSIKFSTTPNESNITYSSLSDQLDIQKTITTNDKELKLVPGNYQFKISSNGYNSMIYIQEIIEDEVRNVNIVLTQDSTVNIDMVYIEKGFLLADASGLMIDEFRIDKNEVTNNDFMKFVSSGGYGNPSLWKVKKSNLINEFIDETKLPGPRNWSGSIYPEGTDNQPVSNISWYEADAYCKWQGKKLPTFRQWWRAAIGDEEYSYPWGNSDVNIEKRANFDTQRAWDVKNNVLGSSKYGAYDMAGNVAEWSNIEVEGANSAAILGGSWQDSSYIFDINVKENLPLKFNSNNIGFRCAI